MELQLKNIGMIKEANIKIDGLTVIAGENNTGKSTVGKLLFSITKASSRYKEDLEEDKEAKIFSLIERNYFQLRRKIDFAENIKLRELFYPPKFKQDIDEKLLKAIDARLDYIKKERESSLFSINEKNKDYLEDIERNLQYIRSILLQKDNKQEAQKRAFQKVLMSEFKGKISNQKDKEDETSIKIFEGENAILHITIIDDIIEDFSILDDLYYKDATFIEGPVNLQLSEAIDNAKTYFEDIDKEDRIIHIRRPNVPLHIKDLNDKLKVSFYEDEYLDIADIFTEIDVKGLLSQLSEIIGGRIKYLKKEKDFAYITDQGTKHSSLNTATGIKSFGIIQMLLKSDLIDERSLLILDEPEVHLHPKWQLSYAEMIVELVKNNINVLVTSHSPYMIEALQRYSEMAKINSNFYLAKDDYIKKVNDNNSETLSKIFEKLSEPFDVFELMEEESLGKLING